MRIAITGSTGRLGSVLVDRLSRDHEVIPLDRRAMDLADRQSIEHRLTGLDCEVLIHTAAITSLESCEDDPLLAMRVNSAAPGKLALWAAERRVRMIHFSTDYVFDGRLPGSRIEPEAAVPVNAYGRSKLAGERAVLAHPGNLVLRVSWLYGGGRPSFVEQMMDLALAGEPLAAVADKWSIPTAVTDLADWLQTLLAIEVEGVLHACAGGNPASWYDVASFIVSHLQAAGALAHVPELRKQALGDVPAMRAPRPRHTGMSNERLCAILGRPLPSWQQALAAYIGTRLAG